MPSSTISKSKKYSRKRNYRKRRHSRRMQRKSRSRNAYNRRRRTMFGGAPEGVYKVTADTLEGNDEKANQQNSENESVLGLLKTMGYLNDEYVSTDKFNDDFKDDTTSKTVDILDTTYTVTVTPNGDNYNVNVKTVTGMNGNVTFTKVTVE